MTHFTITRGSNGSRPEIERKKIKPEVRNKKKTGNDSKRKQTDVEGEK